ncbi:MAG: hypothetical protein AAFY15_15700, partial [Cyanobacteria bacterium J06648_11]
MSSSAQFPTDNTSLEARDARSSLPVEPMPDEFAFLDSELDVEADSTPATQLVPPPLEASDSHTQLYAAGNRSGRPTLPIAPETGDTLAPDGRALGAA